MKGESGCALFSDADHRLSAVGLGATILVLRPVPARHRSDVGARTLDDLSGVQLLEPRLAERKHDLQERL